MVLSASNKTATSGHERPPWQGAQVGESLLVRTTERDPLFWLGPVEIPGSVLGAIEIGLDGSLRGQMIFYTSPETLAGCPQTVTRNTAEEALEEASNLLARYPGAAVSGPIYVREDLRQELAWMIEVSRSGKILSRIFVTPGYVWERRPEEPLPPPGMRG